MLRQSPCSYLEMFRVPRVKRPSWHFCFLIITFILHSIDNIIWSFLSVLWRILIPQLHWCSFLGRQFSMFKFFSVFFLHLFFEISVFPLVIINVECLISWTLERVYDLCSFWIISFDLPPCLLTSYSIIFTPLFIPRFAFLV